MRTIKEYYLGIELDYMILNLQDREEVIIYSREEFKRTYRAMHNHVNDIFLMDHHLSRDDNIKLMGHWHWIMERIHI